MYEVSASEIYDLRIDIIHQMSLVPNMEICYSLKIIIIIIIFIIISGVMPFWWGKNVIIMILILIIIIIIMIIIIIISGAMEFWWDENHYNNEINIDQKMQYATAFSIQ